MKNELFHTLKKNSREKLQLIHFHLFVVIGTLCPYNRFFTFCSNIINRILCSFGVYTVNPFPPQPFYPSSSFFHSPSTSYCLLPTTGVNANSTVCVLPQPSSGSFKNILPHSHTNRILVATDIRHFYTALVFHLTHRECVNRFNTSVKSQQTRDLTYDC